MKAKIEHIKLEEKVPVYDLVMTEENPCFSLKSGIISHNTVPSGSELREIYTPRSEENLICHWDYCWSKNTKIRLYDDRIFTIEELVEEHKKYNLKTYSHEVEYIDSTLTFGSIKNVWATKKAETLLRITLDNGYSLDMTHNHRLYRPNKAIVEAKDLVIGDYLFSTISKKVNNWNSEFGSKHENLIVSKIEEIEYNDYVYQLEVEEDFHNYFVIASEDKSEMILSKNSQKEIKVLAMIANETNLIKAFNEGRDIHRYIASNIWGKPEDEITETERRFAKGASFGILYGKGIASFAADFFHGDMDKAQALFDGFFGAFPGIKTWIEGQHKFISNHDYVETIFGDPIKIIVPPGKRGEGEAARRSVNYVIQSSASSVAGYSIWVLHNRLKMAGINNLPFGFTHDSNDLEFEASKLFEFIDILLEVVVDNVKSQFNIPASVDWEIGTSMANMMHLTEVSRRPSSRGYHFECPKESFDSIIDRIKKYFNVEYTIEEDKEKYESLKELFITRRAYSKQLGTTISKLSGTLNLSKINSVIT